MKESKILIVDDHNGNILVLENILSDMDFSVLQARTREDALSIVVNNEIALILLSVQMNGEEDAGYKTANLIKDVHKDIAIPVIFLTAMELSPEFIFEGYKVGAVDFLSKPVDPFILKQKVNVFLKLHEYEYQLKSRLMELEEKNVEMGKLNTRIQEYAHQLELKSLEAENANRAKSIFLANISHEIRTPMNAILGFTDILYEDEFDPVKKRKLEIIKQSGNFLLNLINDLLDLSKIEAGKIEIVRSEFSLFNLLEEVHYLFSETAKKQNLFFKIDLSERVPEFVFGDERYLKQVIINLVSNSFKFTEAGGVTIACDYGDEKLKVKVIDTGIGISPEDQKKIFEVFKQAEAARKSKFKGTGLGLTIGRSLVSLMEGSFSVESEIGKGAAFCVSLPMPAVEKHLAIKRINDKAEQQNSEMLIQTWLNNFKTEPLLQKILLKAVKSMPSRLESLEKSLKNHNLKEIEFQAHNIKGFAGSVKMVEISDLARKIEYEMKKTDYELQKVETYLNQMQKIINNIPEQYKAGEVDTEELQTTKSQLRILVAEDDELNLEIIKAFLFRMGFSCDLADNGKTALEMLSRKEYDILLLDINMPIMNGLEAIKYIRSDENYKSLRVIALTAYSMKGDKEKFLAAGFNDYISKPIDKNKLWEKVWK